MLSKAPFMGLLLALTLICSVSHSAGPRCDQALFNTEEVIQIFKRSNPYNHLSPYEILDILAIRSKNLMSLLFRPGPNPELMEQNLEDLRYLLASTSYKLSKLHLEPDAFRLYRHSLATIEAALVKQIELSSLPETIENADLFAVNLKMLLLLRGNFMVAQDRLHIGKMIFKLWPHLFENKMDAMISLKHIRYRPSTDETRELLRRVKNDWEKPRVELQQIEMLANLIAIVDNVPEKFLRRIIYRYYQNLWFVNHEVIYHYPLFLWTLVQANPGVAYEFAKNNIKRLPIPLSHKMASNWSNQLQFSALYFRYVLKKPSARLEGLLPDKSFVPDHDVKTTQEQVKLEKLFKEHFPDLKSEHLIPDTPFTADFYVPSEKLIIEVDGDIHFLLDQDSRQFMRRKDLRREEILKAMGYKVIRFGPKETRDLIQGKAI